MSLLVNIFVLDENGRMDIVENNQINELAGFESCRTNLYGNDISKNLGLKLLPLLADESALYIQNDELDILEKEIKVILDNLELYVNQGFYDGKYISARLQNVLESIWEAKNINDGQIVIW